MKQSAWTRAVALVMAVSASGCYRYLPSEPAAIPPGERVRVYVTRDALSRLGEFPLDGNTTLNGTFIRAEPTNLVVRLPVTTRRTGFNMEVLGQDVFIPRDQVLQLDRREVNRGMTALLTVAGSAALAGMVMLIMTGARQGDQQPVPGDVELAPRGIAPSH